jgi:hypothetical protein
VTADAEVVLALDALIALDLAADDEPAVLDLDLDVLLLDPGQLRLVDELPVLLVDVGAPKVSKGIQSKRRLRSKSAKSSSIKRLKRVEMANGSLQSSGSLVMVPPPSLCCSVFSRN